MKITIRRALNFWRIYLFWAKGVVAEMAEKYCYTLDDPMIIYISKKIINYNSLYS